MITVPGLTPRQCRTLRREGDCIVKTTQLNEAGYAHVSVRRPDGTWTRAKAHRVVALAAIGGPPDFYRTELHHTCFVRNCVNPGHLMWVSIWTQNRARDPERRYRDQDSARYRAERDRKRKERAA